MVSPRFLPRTLLGAGGVRLIDMPGVKYPESVLRGPKGADSVSGKAHEQPPEWGVSSRDAAKRLSISVRAARALLNRHNADYRLVVQPGQPACLYWDKRVVDRLVALRMPLVQKVPDKLCTSKEACYILLVSRSSLFRYVKKGIIREYTVRHVTKTGVRTVSYYLRAEVRKLAARMRAARARMEHARKERLERMWNVQQTDESPPPH